jgi:hypothetical protein
MADNMDFLNDVQQQLANLDQAVDAMPGQAQMNQMQMDEMDEMAYGDGSDGASNVKATAAEITALFAPPKVVDVKGYGDDDTASFLAEQLRRPTSTVRELSFAWHDISEDGAAVINAALKTNTWLTHLLLQGDRASGITDVGAAAVTDALLVNTTVTHVLVDAARLTTTGAEAVAKLLRETKSLKTFDFFGGADDEVSEGNVVAVVAAGLAVNTSVTTTAIQWLDSIEGTDSVEGIEALSDALKVNTVLTDVDLSDANFGCAGAKLLAAALSDNKSVKEIRLFANGIEDAGAKALADMLQLNTTLVDLDLEDNRIGCTGAKSFARALKRPACALTGLRLDHNHIVRL